jgi:D-lyxose ketol-isomerase
MTDRSEAEVLCVLLRAEVVSSAGETTSEIATRATGPIDPRGDRMTRSHINALIRDAEAFFADHRFPLPPFARWTPEEWRERGPEADEVREKRLGWDLTDFGSGDFARTGLLLVTLRNGEATSPNAARNYAEKIMIVSENQVTPWHFHWSKAEDIINRGGGELVIEVARATDDDAGLSDREVVISCDGVARTLPPRGRIVLKPGESVTLLPRIYHTFYGAPGRGRVLVGEVSRTNDDDTDNRFLEPLGRFPEIEEDEAAYRLLCNEYPPTTDQR